MGDDGLFASERFVIYWLDTVKDQTNSRGGSALDEQKGRRGRKVPWVSAMYLVKVSRGHSSMKLGLGSPIPARTPPASASFLAGF